MAGPSRSPHKSSDSLLSLVPFGAGGLDEFTHDSLLSLDHLRQADNVRNAKGSLERRKGSKKLWKFDNVGASKTFGTDGKYATITAATQLEGLVDGFAFFFHIEATRAGAGNTAYVVSSRVAAQTYHVLQASIDENGLLSVTFEKTSGGACTVTTAAIDAGATTHGLALFDPVGGTFTVYINGAASGTPVTGLTVADGPIAGSSTDWYFGVHWNPSAGPAAVVANTHFDGKCQAFTLLSLRGMRPASGNTTLVDTLIRHSARIWPTPQAPNVLFHYDMHHTSATVLYDASRHKNDGALTGTPTNTAALTSGSNPANFVGYLDGADGRGDNVVGSAGRLNYQTTKAGD